MSLTKQVSEQPEMFLQEVRRINAEFDRRQRTITGDFYSSLQASNLLRFTQRMRELAKVLISEGVTNLEKSSILEIGCGSRPWLLDFLYLGAQANRLSGLDLSKQSVAKASDKLAGADLRVGNAADLPWPENHFDLVLQSTVFTSILNKTLQERIAQEMLRVLKPDGFILWYDFRYNNPKNPNVRGVTAEQIHSLFAECQIRLRKVTLAPPIARPLVPVSWVVCLILEKVPFLRTHYLGVIRRKR